MTDKEVGELWREHTTQASCSHPFQTAMDKIVIAFIRKLIEERKQRYGDTGLMEGEPPKEADCTMLALRDFDIDEKEYNRVKP